MPRKKPRVLVVGTGAIGGTITAQMLAVGARYRRLRLSMLQAIERGRPPAVDFHNGEVVERGQYCGVRTPVNHLAQQLVREIARGQRKPGWRSLRGLYEETRSK